MLFIIIIAITIASIIAALLVPIGRDRENTQKPATPTEPNTYKRYNHSESKAYIIHGSLILTLKHGSSYRETITEIFELNNSYVICHTHYDNTQYVGWVLKPCTKRDIYNHACNNWAPGEYIDSTEIKTCFQQAGYIDDDAVNLY